MNSLRRRPRQRRTLLAYRSQLPGSRTRRFHPPHRASTRFKTGLTPRPGLVFTVRKEEYLKQSRLPPQSRTPTLWRTGCITPPPAAAGLRQARTQTRKGKREIPRAGSLASRERSRVIKWFKRKSCLFLASLREIFF